MEVNLPIGNLLLLSLYQLCRTKISPPPPPQSLVFRKFEKVVRMALAVLLPHKQ